MNKIAGAESDDMLILKAKLYIYSGSQMKTAVELLEGIIEKNNKRSLEEVYTLASARRLLLDLVLRNPGVVVKASISNHAWHCQREHGGLFGSMNAYPLRTYGMKLLYLDAILSSYVVLGRVNLYVGSVRECLCFLQAAADMAKLLLLPLREADIAITQAKLNCFLEDLAGAEMCLRHAHMTLTSQMTISRPVIHDEADTLSKEPRSKAASVKQTETFGFESDGDADNDSFTINEPALSDDEDPEYKMPTYAKGTRDDAASPSLNNKRKFGHNFADWEPYQHIQSCKCESCGDIMLQLGHLHVLECLSVYRLKSGLTEEAIAVAKESLRHCTTVEAKVAALGHAIPADLTSCRLSLHKSIMEGWLSMRNYRAMEEEWAVLDRVERTGYHVLIMCHLTYLSYLPQVMQYYQSQTRNLESKREYLIKASDNVCSPLQTINTNKTSVGPQSSVINAPRKTRLIALNKVTQLAFDDSDTEDAQVLSVKRSGRSSKSGKSRAQKLGSLRHAPSPLARKPTKLKNTKNTPISVFCDDDALEEKKSTKKRGKTCSGDMVEQVRPIRSTRRIRSSSRETLRSLSADSENISAHRLNLEVSPVLEVFSPEQDFSTETRSGLLSTIGSGDSNDSQGIELLRGDEITQRPRNRKYSAAESMRASAPSQYSSPPELLTSPTEEFISPLTIPTDSERQVLINRLTAIWMSISARPPYQLYKAVCQSLAVLHHKQSDSWLSAFYLMETQAITFTHKSNLVSAQKEYQHMKEPQAAFPILKIKSARNLKDFKSAANSLPIGVTACNISVVSTPEKSLQQLYVTRLEKNQEPVVLLATDMQHPQEIWKEFEEILEASRDSMKVTQKVVWWNRRRQIDDRLKDLLNRMQKELGVARAALLGCYEDSKSRQVVDKCTDRVIRSLTAAGVTMSRSLVKMLVNGADSLNEKELSQFLLQQQPALSEAVCLKLADTIKEGDNVTIDRRALVIICLDKGAHSVCWESMPYISESAVTRMPSIYAIQSSLKALSAFPNIYANGIDSDKAFYVLNPEDNLPSTQSTFHPILSGKKTWKGIVGKKPTAEEYKKGLTFHDLFIFLGHGSGSKYLKPRELCKLNCTAAVLLMGCSSGAFDSRGEMESAGIIYDYHMSNCPSVMACLWDVTDKDIDRFTKSILNSWLLAGGNGSLLDCIAAARRACKLQYLVGCASVVYGLPVSLRTNK
ncbi:separin-like [Watersipora subatra]|uniref:separin-like n=1 Tax=Watersipora subatra TaxID=2589382 RepID=UPI00355B6F11